MPFIVTQSKQKDSKRQEDNKIMTIHNISTGSNYQLHKRVKGNKVRYELNAIGLYLEDEEAIDFWLQLSLLVRADQKDCVLSMIDKEGKK